ncbi:MAG: ABC transporter substrate-binding protein [Anaerolineae bacterium]|nr:ABC transporter substrate-binding protein [Anaerolineae bacterium]
MLALMIWGLIGWTACRPVGVMYIGLVAPFEGRDRAIGYDVIFGARLAVRAWNEAHPRGPFVVVVAFDDQGDPALARERARQVVSYPGLIAVIGHFRPETTKVAAPIYRAVGIPLIAPLLPADRISEGALPTAPDQQTMVEAFLQTLPSEGERSLWIARDEEEEWFGPELAGLFRERGWTVREARWEEVFPRGKEPVLFDGRAVHALEAVRRWRRDGWQGPLWGGAGLLHPDSGLLRNAGEVWIVAETRSTEDRGWTEAYRAIALGATPGPYAPLGYDLVWVLMQMRTRVAFQWEGKTGIWKWEQGRLRKNPAWFLEHRAWLPD